MTRELPPLESDPVIEAYKKDIDRTLIRENLKLTHSQRVEKLIELRRFAEELRRAGSGLPASSAPMSGYSTLLRALCGNNVRFMIVGGAAARIHGSRRLTDDLDVLCARDPQNLERLYTALIKHEPHLRGTRPGVPLDPQRFTSLRIRTPSGKVHEVPRHDMNIQLATTLGPLDVLGLIGRDERFEDFVAGSLEVSLCGFVCRSIGLPDLIRLKRNAGRPKDLAALPELEALHQRRRSV